MKTLKIATRKSPLAIWQAKYVRQCLLDIHKDLHVELVGMMTEGDRFLESSLIEVGGKGLFIKELEQAILKNRADIAVHSMKDVTTDLPEGFILPVVMRRENTHDVLISNQYQTIADIPAAGVVGTSSLRRRSQLMAMRPDIVIKDLRGNIGTRIGKLDAGQYDAIILAAAGIKRLGLEDRVVQFIPHDKILPAIGQGAIGIECWRDNESVQTMIAPLNDEQTQYCVAAERSLSRRLYGGCQLPIAGQAMIKDNKMGMTGLVARVDGTEIIRSTMEADIHEGEQLGMELGERLLSSGGESILHETINGFKKLRGTATQ